MLEPSLICVSARKTQNLNSGLLRSALGTGRWILVVSQYNLPAAPPPPPKKNKTKQNKTKQNKTKKTKQNKTKKQENNNINNYNNNIEKTL